MPESKQQMAAYIINDAVDDFQDVIDGVRELSKMFKDEKLVQMVSDLQRMSYYVEQRKSFLDKIKNEPQGEITFTSTRSGLEGTYEICPTGYHLSGGMCWPNRGVTGSPVRAKKKY